MRWIENFLVPWLTIAASLYTTALLLWLGALVLFSSAGNRKWGHETARDSWWAGGGLLLAGIAMAAHTVMLDYSLDVLLDRIGSWWRPLWVGMIGVPAGWATLALIYSGYNLPGSALRARSRTALWVCGAMGVIALGTGLGIEPRQIALQFAALEESTISSTMLALCSGYTAYLLLCLALSADALFRPEASGRLLRDLARRRARPYLLGATAALGLAAISILAVFGRAAWLALRYPALGTVNALIPVFDGLELLVSLFACIAVACVGKAVASYEIFSGLALPRAAIAGSWHGTAVALGAFSLAVAALLGWESKGAYTIVASACALAVTGAWLAARLDAAQRLLVQAPADMNGISGESLSALELALDARAELQPAGAVAALLGEVSTLLPVSPGVLFTTPQSATEPWTIPLRRGTEFCGVLRLWPRRPHTLFTEDAVALARGTGEKILEARAAHALSQQLIEAQRRAAHQGESLEAAQALGGRTRRALHDELLPRLHAALLQLSALPQAQEASTALAEAHKMLSDILREAPPDAREELSRFGLWTALQRAADTEFDAAPFTITWRIEGTAQAATLPHECEETLFHAAREILRNARRYACGTNASAPLTGSVNPHTVNINITAVVQEGALMLSIEDDGVGLGARVPSLGGGQGLALHGALLAVVHGSLRMDERPGGGTRVSLQVPISWD